MDHDEAERFFELSPDLLCVRAPDGRFIRVSRGFERLGYTADEVLQKKAIDFVHPDDVDVTRAAAERAAGGSTVMRFENRWRRKDGSYCWLSWTASADESGTIYAIARDVDDTKRMEESLRETNQFLDAVIENIPNMVFVKDADRLAFVRFNRAGEQLLGMSRDELVGKTDFDLFPETQAVFFQKKDRQTLAGGGTIDITSERIQTRRGERFLHTKKVPILDERGVPRYLLGISEDITDVRAADELRGWLAALVQNSSDAIIGRTVAGTVTTWNEAAERMFGYTAAEIIGQPIAILHPEARSEDELAATERVVHGDHVAPFETVRRHKDGHFIEVSVSFSPVCDGDGNVIGVAKIARDVTELKRTQRELVRAKEVAEASNRELEAFSYSVAHDLRSPLRSIDGFSQALLEDYASRLDEAGRQYLERIRASAQLMAQLIDDILMLARITRTELRPEEVDLSGLGRRTRARLEQSEPDRRVDFTIDEGLLARGDSRLLGVVVDNLLGNAWKFSAKKDEARIHFGVTEEAGERRFFVRDNGAGFDLAHASKLFGLFQRLHTRREFEGTGVGLATVHRIIQRHGGRVWADAKPGEGAVFYFTLPAAK